jgi:tetratricopeptide (TPR) repeat protein
MAKARKGSISARQKPGTAKEGKPAAARKAGPAAASPVDRSAIRWQILAAAAVLVMLGVAYGGTLHHSFHFDDYNIIVNNDRLFQFDLPTIISSNYFRPVLFVTFALNYHFGGPDPFGYHLVNLGLHLLNMALVFYLISVLVGVVNRGAGDTGQGWQAIPRFYPALLGAAIFGLHPLQTESVTYIASRSSVLCTTFILLTVVAFLAARIEAENGPLPLGRRIAWLGLATVSFVLGVATKELGICAPLILLLLEYLFFSRGTSLAGKTRNIVRYHLPFLALIIFGAGLRLAFMFRLHNPAEFRSPWHNLLSQFRVVVRYMVMMFLPVNQNVDPDIRTSESLFEPSVILSLVLILLLLAFGWVLRKRQPLATLGIFIWFTALLPTSSIIPLRDLMSEHRVYLPMVGVALLAAALPGMLAPRPAKAGRIALAATLVVGLLLTVATFQRNKVWFSGLTLWEDSVSKAPEKERPVMHYANAISGTGQLQKAKGLYEKVLTLNPENATARYNLGIIYKQLGDYDRAVEEWRQVVRLEPGHPNVHVNIGNYHYSREEMDQAFLEFRAEIWRNPRNPLGHYNLGNYWRKVGELERAEASWVKALRFKNDLQVCRLRLGTLYFETQRLGKARQQFEAVLRFNPRSAAALFNLGHVCYQEGQVAEAAALYERSANADRNFIDPLINAGTIYLRELNQPQKGVAMLREVLKRNPNHPSANSIRQTLAGMGLK